MSEINWRPLRKIVATGLTGITATGVVTLAADMGLDVPAGVGALVAAAASVVAGYLVPERREA